MHGGMSLGAPLGNANAHRHGRFGALGREREAAWQRFLAIGRKLLAELMARSRAIRAQRAPRPSPSMGEGPGVRDVSKTRSATAKGEIQTNRCRMPTPSKVPAKSCLNLTSFVSFCDFIRLLTCRGPPQIAPASDNL
jgi:hypothetical protein